MDTTEFDDDQVLLAKKWFQRAKRYEAALTSIAKTNASECHCYRKGVAQEALDAETQKAE